MVRNTKLICLSILNSEILIYGAGSIGSLYGGLLALHPNIAKILFLGREPHITAINKNGLKLITPEQKINHIYSINGYSYLSNILEIKLDILIVANKAYDNSSVVNQLSQSDLITKNTSLVIIQNGVGNEEHFLSIFPPENIYRIITTEGANLKEPGVVNHTGRGFTLIGRPLTKESVDDFTIKFANILNQVGLQSTPLLEIQEAIWNKCLINASINPLATLHRVKNGELVKRNNLKAMLKNIVDEIVEIYNCRNISIPTNQDPYKMVLKVANATANNYCSMLQDIQHGRPTEIDYFNGKIIQEAQAGGIHSPLNDYLMQKIKELEKKRNFQK